MRHRRPAVVLAALATAVVVVGAAAGALHGRSAGSPERGRAVYFGPGGCANCHAASADPSEPSTGPELTVATMRAHAALRGKPFAEYVAESILVPSAFAPPGYVAGTMQPPRGLTDRQIEDLVSYLVGAPWTAPAGGALGLPKRPLVACTASASCRAQVRRWTRVERLPASAVPGAKIVAVSGCLSCHRYAGSGKTAGGAPDLTRAGVKAATVAARIRHLKCPSCVVRGSAMPSYAAYGDANLRLVAEFLRASRGTR